jgi:cell division protein FtsZ
MFEIEESERPIAKIKVIGVGGAGTNAVNTMISAGIYGVEFIAVNTDIQHLEISLAPIKVQIGKELTKGLGAGSDPELGKKAALDDKDSLLACLEGTDLLFITAGMGGGTGTGASQVIASLARDLGILTVAVVTKPFYFEGKKRLHNAVIGIKELKKYVDTIIIIPNDKIHLVVEKGTPLVKSFAIANDILRQAIQGISDLILSPGFINRDFADVKTIIENSGKAVIGLGTSLKEEGARQSAIRAIKNPFLEETSIEGAKRILINITGGLNLTLDEVQEIATTVYDVAHEEANIIFGTVIKPEIENEIFVTVIATGFEDKTEEIDISKAEKWVSKKENLSLKETKKIISKNVASITSLKKTLIHDDLFSPNNETATNTNKQAIKDHLSSSLNSIENKEKLETTKDKIFSKIEDGNTVIIENGKEVKENSEKIHNSEKKIDTLKEPYKEVPEKIEDESDIPAYLRKKMQNN